MASSRQGFAAALRGVCQVGRPQWQQPLEQQFGALRIGTTAVSSSCSRSRSRSRSRLTTTTSRRSLSTTPTAQDNDSTSDFARLIRAAEEIDFVSGQGGINPIVRPIPASPSYFSRIPVFNDAYLQLDKLLRTYGNLPTIPASQVDRVAWKTLKDFRQSINEQVKSSDFSKCMAIVKRLHQIHPKLKPAPVVEALEGFKRDVQGFLNVSKPVTLDRFGRALASGGRKASTATAWVVEGDGEFFINGKTLAEHFGRVHDRETASWPLHATNRLDKYNVWADVKGGGTTGQAEALTLAVARALLIHEPALKPALRRAGCVTRDPRRVERKKAGHLKARKMPTWVKR